MGHLRTSLAVFLAVVTSIFGDGQAGEVRVAVASNFKAVLDELIPQFEEETGHDVIVSAGSTGKLYAQIVAGAPYDVFLAADAERPARLVAEGLAQPGFTYATGRLVLWAPRREEISAKDIRAGTIDRLALANAALAPYGAAAEEVIVALAPDLSVAPKIVRGENIGQAFAFVATGNADAGFVALSQVLSVPEEKRGAIWIPPDGLYTPIRQDAVLLTDTDDNEAARTFVDYLKEPETQALISRYGYQ